MRKFIILALIGLCISCGQKPEYKYVIIKNEESFLGDMSIKESDPKIIEAENDSIAYVQTYKYFAIERELYNNVFSGKTRVLDFKLFNPAGEEISKTVSFVGKDELEEEITAKNKQRTIDDKERQKEISAEKQSEIVNEQFSAWDGSHIELTKLIKKAMHDPDSYKHVETKYWNMNDYIVVRTVYSGKNAFGGRVKNFVKAKYDNNGNLLEILEEGTGD